MENQTLTSFHGKADVKTEALKAIRLLPSVTSIHQLTGKNSYAEFETQFGIPRQVARLAAAIMEGLPADRTKEYITGLIASIPIGADITGKWRTFMVQLLLSGEFGTILHLKNEQHELLAAKMAAYFSMRGGNEAIPNENLKELATIAKESDCNALRAIAATAAKDSEILTAIRWAARLPADAAGHQAELAYKYAEQNEKDTPESKNARNQAAKLAKEIFYQAIAVKLLDILQHS